MLQSQKLGQVNTFHNMQPLSNRDEQMLFEILERSLQASLRATMANEFLMTKWRLWYQSLDVNHDKVISLDDVEESRKKFSELHHLSAEEKESTMKSIEQWWEKYIFRGSSGQEITQEQFLNRLNAEFKSNKEKFMKDKRDCFSTILGVIDINHDKFIDQDEFVLCFRAYGHENLTADTDFFNAYKPVDGKVPVKVIVDSWTDFLSSEDSSKESIEKKAFESGV